MNRMHRSVWNSALGAWVAVPENARARGKRSASHLGSVCALMATMWCAGMPDAHACTAGTTAELAACIAGSDQVIDLTASIVLNAQLPVVGRDVTINGNGHSLDGAGRFRGFFIGAGTTTVNGLTMENLLAQGGRGGSEKFPGGGGMGAGAAVFVVSGAGANLNDVIVINNTAAVVSSDANLGDVAGGLFFEGGQLRTTADVTTDRATTLQELGTIESFSGTTLTHRGTIEGSGALVKDGLGTLVLTGANTYRGGTIVGAGTLSVSADENLGEASGPLAVYGTLRITRAFATSRSLVGSGTFQTDADFVANGVIEGSGGTLIKTGAGTLTLAGDNTYRNGTRIDEGVVSVSSNANLGMPEGNVDFNGGTLRATGSFAMNRESALGEAGGTIDTLAGTAVTQQGAISGAGGLVKTGDGTLTLTGENSYSGGTDLKQGSIAVTHNSALGTGELAMHPDTTLRFAADGLTLANPIAFTDALDPTIDTGPFTATLTGAITGPGDLSKIGSGTLVLSGANSYTGATAVTEVP